MSFDERQMTEKGNKKRYKEELLEHFGDKKAVQASLKRYKQRSEEGNAPPVEDPLLDDLSDDDDDFTESQESTLGNYVESEKKIAFIAEQIKHTESKMKAYAQQNTQNTEWVLTGLDLFNKLAMSFFSVSYYVLLQW